MDLLLDLIQTDAISTPFVALRGARRCVIRHRRRVLERAAILQRRGDRGGPERVVADLLAEAGHASAVWDGGLRRDSITFIRLELRFENSTYSADNLACRNRCYGDCAL